MKRFLQVSILLLIFIGILFGVLSLTGSHFRSKSTLLTSTACHPPCWYGLQPGKSTLHEVRAFLDTYEGVRPETIFEKNRNDQVTQVDWRFQKPAGDIAGYIFFEQGTVTAITIATSGSLTLKEAFSRLGEPQLIWSGVETANNQRVLEIFLLYPQKGYFVKVDPELEGGQLSGFITLPESEPVTFISYFDPARLDHLLGTLALPGTINLRVADFQPWQGPGKIEYLER